MSERPWRGRQLHFVGVGGAGMSGYARAAHALGATVSGSDKSRTVYLERLISEGILDPSIGHRSSNLPAGAGVEVIHSSAIAADNPERIAARERGLEDRPRAALLAELTALRRTIAVAGAHGKTTTSSMIVHVLREAGLDPSWLVGSSVGQGLDNSYWAPGDGSRGEELLVVEADESDRSMLSLEVDIAVLTNVELDHHATFGSLAELREAFREFLAHAREAVVVWNRPELLTLLEPSDDDGGKDDGNNDDGSKDEGTNREESTSQARTPMLGHAQVIRYDVSESESQLTAKRFRWRGAPVQLAVAGAHNMLNAAAALEVARLAGVAGQARTAIAGFTGAARRFQRLGTTAGGATVIDDYAHHPTEVMATLTAARTLNPKRLVAVFQPHLYSRTTMLADEFGQALVQADVIVLLDVYAARERAEDHPNVSGATLLQSTRKYASGQLVLWSQTFERAEQDLRELLTDGDLCVVMGAGDVDTLARRLVS